MKKYGRSSAAALAMLLLNACGGGGGGGAKNDPPTSAPPPQRGILAFEMAVSSVNEKAGTIDVTVSRTSGTDGEVGATVSLSGTASAGSDFTAPASTFTIASGAASATIKIALVDDDTTEEDETVVLTLSSPTGGASLGAAIAHTLTIKNDDAPTATTLKIDGATIKQLKFSWAASATATHYQLLRNPDGVAGYLPALSNITGTSAILPVSVHLHDWAGARYKVSACNAAGCTESTEISTLQAHMLAAIGVLASPLEVDDNIGFDFAISSDGNVFAIGNSGEASNAKGVNGDATNHNAPGAGAVFVYERKSEGEWVQQAYIKASNTRTGASFGSSVSLSDDGRRLAVGSIMESSGASGVDADQTDTSAPAAGAVYIFDRAASGNWSQSAYIKASNADQEDLFGIVSLSGDGKSLAVGASFEDSGAVLIDGAQDDDSTPDTGAVYTFQLGASRWVQSAYIKPHVRIGVSAKMQLGQAVALDRAGTTLVAGTDSYGAYIYRRNGNVWTFEDVVNAGTNGLAGGLALSRDGSTLVAGTRSYPYQAFVWRHDASGWGSEGELPRPDSATQFGSKVVVGETGQCIAVNAYQEGGNGIGVNNPGLPDNSYLAGVVRYYEKNAAGLWAERTLMKAPVYPIWTFGAVLAMTPDCKTIAARANTPHPFRGVVYFY